MASYFRDLLLDSYSPMRNHKIKWYNISNIIKNISYRGSNKNCAGMFPTALFKKGQMTTLVCNSVTSVNFMCFEGIVVTE